MSKLNEDILLLYEGRFHVATQTECSLFEPLFSIGDVACVALKKI